MLLYQESSLQSPRSPQTSTRDGCHQEVLHHAAPYTIWNHAYHRFQMHNCPMPPFFCHQRNLLLSSVNVSPAQQIAVLSSPLHLVQKSESFNEHDTDLLWAAHTHIRWVCLGPGVCTCARQIPGAGPLALLTIPLVLLAHEKCRACPLKITVMFISNTSNRLIRGRRVKGEGARNLCLVACVRLGGIPIFLVNMVL